MDPRIIDPDLLTAVGVLQGATVFLERGGDLGGLWNPIFYVLRSEDCRFQAFGVPIV